MSTAAADPRTGRVDKRRAVLDAAGPVFGTAGYERASVDAIASAAGVSKPTIYAYFGNKEQLFREAMADIAQQVNEASMDELRGLDLHPDRWRESLHTLARSLARCRTDGCAAALGRLVLAETRRDPEVFAEVRRSGADPLIDALAGRLAMLGNSGLLHVPDPYLAARHFLALSQARLTELTAGGTVAGDAEEIRTSIDDGVEAFLRAYATRD